MAFLSEIRQLCAESRLPELEKHTIDCADSVGTNGVAMVAEYKEKLIPQEMLQRSLEEFVSAIEKQ